MTTPMGVTREHHEERTARPEENKPEFPTILLGEKHLQKLGFHNLPPVGTPMKMMSRVEVTGSMMHDGEAGKERMLHLKITHMTLGKGHDDEEHDRETKGKILYGDEKEK